jgi:shikimate kinase/3-dehydroquinate synthase
MGAGKSTLGPELADRLGRPFVSVDALVEERAGKSVSEVFAERGEAAFRVLEEEIASEVLGRRALSVVELGGGALGSVWTRTALALNAFSVYLETTPEEAWDRVARVAGSERPLARDEAAFRALFGERAPLYDEVADGRARDLDGVVLVAAGVQIGSGVLDRLAELVPGAGAVGVVADVTVSDLYGEVVRAGLGDRLAGESQVPAGEVAKSIAEAERLWLGLRLERGATLLALGGGSTIDVAGFVAATYLRGIAWVPVPTTLVAQVDAAIGGKTAVDLPEAKNLVGAFHWPAETVIDTTLLETLPDEEWRNGLAEVVKTGLLVGEPLWELDTPPQVRRCAAIKAAICLRDPHEQRDREQLNLGHTFAHALEAASGYTVSHGRAVALGLLAALQLSGLDGEALAVSEILAPDPVAVDRDAAWAALRRDKKTRDGQIRLVLLDAPGNPRVTSDVEPDRVRAALDALIA